MSLGERFGSKVLLGAGTLTVVGALMLLAMVGGLAGLFGGEDMRTVKAVFADGQQLKKGNDVRIDGVRVGEVTDIDLNPGARDATVTMDVEEDAGAIHDDAQAVLRWKTVLGGAFAVDIERGTPNAAALSGPIPVTRTARQVELDDITTILKGDAEKGLRGLPPELADAFRGHGELATLLGAVDKVAPDVTQGVGALRGRELDTDLRGLLRNSASTAKALDRPTGDLQRVISGAAATLQTTGARGDDLRATLAGSPAAMQQTDVTLQRLQTTLDLADPLVARLGDAAPDVAPTLRDLHPTVTGADRLLRRARPLLTSLRPAVRSLAQAGRLGRPVLDDLRPSLMRLDQTIIPMLNEIDPGTSKSTAVMIGGTFTGLASGAGGQMDANGHFIRFPATSGSTPLSSLPCAVYFNNPDAAQKLVCKDLATALETYLSYNPLGTDPPGTAPASRTTKGRTP